MGRSRNTTYEFVAVDFDGTLCADAFPEIGEPRPLVIAYVKQLAAQGSKIILHTSRENGTRKLLDEAVEFCKAQDIPLFAVNENPGNRHAELIGLTYRDNRKMYASLYIEDKAIRPEEIERFMQVQSAVARQIEQAPERDRRTRRERRRMPWASIIKYMVLSVIGILLFAAGRATRGGDRAVGAEVFALLLPVIWYALETTLRDVFADFVEFCKFVDGRKDT